MRKIKIRTEVVYYAEIEKEISDEQYNLMRTDCPEDVIDKELEEAFQKCVKDHKEMDRDYQITEGDRILFDWEENEG